MSFTPIVPGFAETGLDATMELMQPKRVAAWCHTMIQSGSPQKSPPETVGADLPILYEDALLKVSALDRPGSRLLLLCFAGVRHGIGGIDVQRPEFVGSAVAIEASAAFVFDKTTSWGNRVDFARIARLVSPLVRGGKVMGLGNSMGGFNVVLMSNFIAMDTCVAFAPQFSLSSRIVPTETRWRDHAAAAEPMRFHSLQGCFNARTRYVTVNGDSRREQAHWIHFPAQPNVEHVVIRNANHTVAAMMKEAGVLGPFLSSVFAGGPAGKVLDGRLDWFRYGGNRLPETQPH
jgi:hypothetical protein